MIKVIRDISELLEFKAIWDSLYEIDPSVTPFQQFEYVIESLDLLVQEAHNLYIIAVKDDLANRWVAIFPFSLEKKCLNFINSRHSDFCGVIVHPAYNHYKLYNDVSDFIWDDKSIKGIRLDNVAQDSPLLSVFKPHFRYSITHDMNYYSTIPIYREENDSDSVDAFRYVQASRRRKLRKAKNRLTDDYKLKIINRSNEPYPEGNILQIVHSMLDKGIRSKEYFSDRMLRFWKGLYDKGILSIVILNQGEAPISCNFIFHDQKHNQFIKWIMIYTDSSWNMAINVMIADYLYTHYDSSTINFARGIYDYKLVNFHPDVKPLFCVRIAKSKWGHVKNIAAVAFHYSKPIIKSLLGR